MNFYECLGVNQNATTEEIQAAFRDKAKSIHPDYNKRDTAFYEMVELNIARDTLVDATKRYNYDKSLRSETETPEPNSTVAQDKNNKTIFSSFHRLFKYHCKTCGIEMNSTWKGYCLYHYLEATHQLDNEDFIFEYHGNLYKWADPPPELRNRYHKTNTKSNYRITKLHVALYIILLASLGLLLIILYRNMV